MTRVIVIGSDASSARLLARALVEHGIEVLDAEAIEQQERAQQRLLKLNCYEKVDLRIPTMFALEPVQPSHVHFRSLREQSNHTQSAKQQSLRAKARR